MPASARNANVIRLGFIKINGLNFNIRRENAMAKKGTKEISGRRVAIIDGIRTPFLRAGTDYFDLMAYDLGCYAVAALMHKTGLDPDEVQDLIYGIVIPEPKTANIAREVCIGSGLPDKVRCYAVSVACISSNQAATNGADLIFRGYSDCVIAGGCETMSDLPIRFQKKFRQKLSSCSSGSRLCRIFLHVLCYPISTGFQISSGLPRFLGLAGCSHFALLRRSTPRSYCL